MAGHQLVQAAQVQVDVLDHLGIVALEQTQRQAVHLRRLQQHWLGSEPDLVVSLIPNFNRAMHDGLAAARPGVPFVTVLTDLADHPPSFWVEPGVAQHVVCGTGHAVAQALLAGVPAQRVHRVDGMLLRPEFHEALAIDRRAARLQAGLDADTPTGLVLFGGTGAPVMRRIAARLPDTPLVLLCGRNERLAAELRAQPARAPRIVLGPTNEVAHWMRLADFFIGKPGPGSLSEAVQCGLPVIVTRNAWTMPQERWNLQWIRATVGPALRLIPVTQVAYLRSDEKYTLVAWEGGEALIRKTIRELAAELDPGRFVQVHRSVIVNLEQVSEVLRGPNETADIRLRGRAETLPVSRSYLHLFRQM